MWPYDFVADHTHDGKAFRMLCIIDEYTREVLTIRVAHKIGSAEVIEALADLFILRGVPVHIRSENGPEFVVRALREWIAAVGAKTAYIEPCCPGRIATANASTASSVTSCSTVKSSTA